MKIGRIIRSNENHHFFVFQMLNEAGRLKPKFYWVERLVGRYEPGVLPASCVFIFTVTCACIFSILQWGGKAVYHPNGPEWWLIVLLTFLVAVSLISEFIQVVLEKKSFVININ